MGTNLHIIYRISDAGYKKEKPAYINNEDCLRNAIGEFPLGEHTWCVIADNVSEETSNMIQKYIPKENITYVKVGHGAGTFNLALTEALKESDDDIVYFLENDYLHKPKSDKVIVEGFNTGASYVSLYDHPDKYIDGANPYVEDGGEVTRVMLTGTCHWKLTNSTTMTFAAKVRTLREDESILRSYTSETYPRDFQMFLALRDKGRGLVTPIPGYSTHGETAWLTPLIDWRWI